MSVRGEATLGRRKGGDDASWGKADIIGSKNEKNIHEVDSAASNE
jgi:hypothetical protein